MYMLEIQTCVLFTMYGKLWYRKVPYLWELCLQAKQYTFRWLENSSSKIL